MLFNEYHFTMLDCNPDKIVILLSSHSVYLFFALILHLVTIVIIITILTVRLEWVFPTNRHCSVIAAWLRLDNGGEKKSKFNVIATQAQHEKFMVHDCGDRIEIIYGIVGRPLSLFVSHSIGKL